MNVLSKHNLVDMNTRYKIDDGFFDTMGPSQAYFSGLIASDGCIMKGKYIHLGQSGYEGLVLVRQIKQLLGFTGNVHADSTDRHYSIQFTSTKAVEFFAKLGMGERKSLVLEYPPIPSDLDLYFLRGYFDGDGSLGYYSNGAGRMTFSMNFVGTPKFIDSAALKISQHTGLTGTTRKIRTAANLSEYRLYGEKAQTLYRALYNSTSKVTVVSPKTTKYERLKPQMDADEAARTGKKTKRAAAKAKARALLTTGMPVAKIAKEVGIAFQTIYEWKKEKNEDPAASPDVSKGKLPRGSED